MGDIPVHDGRDVHVVNPLDPTKKVSVIEDGSVQRLAVDASVNVFSTGAIANIFEQAEFTATSRNETAIAGISHTVSAGKNLAIVFFGVTADSPAPIHFRLKTGSVVQMKINLGSGLGGNVNSFEIPTPVIVATAGDVVTITIDPSFKNATGWAGFIAQEVPI